MSSTRTELLSFLRHLKVTDVERTADSLLACGIDTPATLADVEADDREDLVAQLKSSDVSIGDRTKVKRVRPADVEAWLLTATDGAAAGPAAAAAAPAPASAAQPKMFVVKATQAIMTADMLLDQGIGKAEVEILEAVAERTRQEIRELIVSCGTRRAELLAAVVRSDVALKEIAEKSDTVAAQINSEMGAVQAAVEATFDEIRNAVAAAVEGRKHALLAEVAAVLSERKTLLEAQRAELDAAATRHAKAEAFGTDTVSKGDADVVGCKAEVAALCVPYEGSLELAVHTSIALEVHGADVGGIIATGAAQISDSVIGFLTPLRMSLELPALPSYGVSPVIEFKPGQEITPLKPCAPLNGANLTAADLPAGLCLDATTGEIRGTLKPSDAGTHRFTVIATSAVGKSESAVELELLMSREQKTMTFQKTPEVSSNNYYGCYFDLTNTSSHPLDILQLEVGSSLSAATHKLYTRTTEEKCLGAETASDQWRLVGTTQITVAKKSTQLLLQTPQTIAAGGAQGFLLHCSAASCAVALSQSDKSSTDGVLYAEGHALAKREIWNSTNGKFTPAGSVMYRK